MFAQKTWRRGLGSLATVALLMVVATGCSSGGTAVSTTPGPVVVKNAPASARSPSFHPIVGGHSQPSQRPAHPGFTGTHPGGGGPQEN